MDDGFGGSVPFAIDSAGVITVNGPLDFETESFYSLTVTGTDPDGNTGFATVDVSVNHINEDPVFSTDWYNFDVDENSATATVVGMVSVSDPQGQSVALTLDDGFGGPVPFAIDPAGEITVNGPLDYETQDYYSLQVTATDSDTNISTAWVDVWINDVEESPICDPDSYSFVVD